ncbi:MAG TPA: M20/M25/M40 family metallo-hydrolase [Steroidobacteraceae bacterium]|nr:M20/M25/M40 family metallo-hydrolase [Steroidobacteraceae bacterium]HRX90882.1 M20/M25/M40 family metallo-hydrolase [Steroidobacteraceae bacterium]
MALGQGYAPQDLAAASELRERALASDTAYELVTSLTTEVGPRPAGSPGDSAALDWAEHNMRQLGFSNVRRMDVVVPHWVRGTASFEVLAPFPQTMPVLALGGSIGTPDTGLEAEIIAVRDLTALATLPVNAVRDRIVFFTGRTERTRDGSGYGKAVQVRAQGPSAAAALGAVGVVIRSIGTSSDRFPHTGALSYNISAPRVPAVALSNPDADALERQLATGKPVRVSMMVSARDLPQKLSANVIGEIPGADQDAEIVLLGAHLDSWDPGTGALDDGAGVAIIMAAAHLIGDTKPRPRRTIRVVLFANEEFGLSGSLAYASKIGDEFARHAVGMEADFGAGPVYQLTSRVPPELLPAIKDIHATIAPLEVELGGNETNGGADLGPLRRLGMPLLAPGLDGSKYFDVHHTANDTLEQVDPAHIRQAAAAFAVSAYLAAQWPGSWGRNTTPPPRQ